MGHPDGTALVYQTIALSQAGVVAVEEQTCDASSPQPASTEINLFEPEQVQFTFQKIEINNQDGSTSFTDTWGAVS